MNFSKRLRSLREDMDIQQQDKVLGILKPHFPNMPKKHINKKCYC